jgi:hypothetical protein
VRLGSFIFQCISIPAIKSKRKITAGKAGKKCYKYNSLQ